MATYLISGRKSGGSTVLAVHLDGIDQDDVVVDEVDVVNAIKAYLMTVPGVTSTIAQKNEYVTTYV
ncbi:hypothetical protein [Streptomyces sp. NPDC088812]|uniref:hypothetical protein n=1 Tax=Streptomyces sp. NPDC088812 TaxID=3365905 RepID=UPI00382B251D